MKKRNMTNVFVSFNHHYNQQHALNIIKVIKSLGYNDVSVNDGTKIENEDSKTDEQIRKEIRDNFLRDVDVTIVLIGTDSTNRKHIDWEIRSSIYKFENEREGSIVGVNLLEKNNSWILDYDLISLHDRNPAPANRRWPENYEMNRENYDWMPERLFNSIKNNYSKPDCDKGIFKHAVFPIINYERSLDPNVLDRAIQSALEWKGKNKGKWDVSSKMRRQNNESSTRKMFKEVPA